MLKFVVNAAMGRIGLRIVNARWGPRGPFAALRRVRDLGVVLDTIVDVGASNGVWTRECLGLFPNAHYFLVDPLPANGPPLAALVREQSKVSYWQGCLGPTAGTQTMFGSGDQASLLPNTSFDTRPSVTIEVRPLDSFLGRELPAPPDLIKVDVQGYELEVLAGAAKCLEHAHLLLLEVSYRQTYKNGPLAHEVIAAVGAKGFRIHDICTYAQRPGDGELVQSDILFARNGSPLFAREDYF